MKTLYNNSGIALLILALFSMISCINREEFKLKEQSVEGNSITKNGFVGNTFNCNNFSYSDSLYFINIDPQQIILPVNQLSGTFTSFPEGLDLDSITGAIDINKSETGLKYRIDFQPSNNAPSCSYFLSIAGINYLDEIFVLDQGQRFAQAIYNGNPAGIIPCSDDEEEEEEEDDDEEEEDEEDDDDDDDESCKFDIDGPDGNKLADFGVSIDHINGEIDMLETLEEETFGENPISGDQRDFTLYYRISDESLSALNKIDLRIYYFETMADVPQELITEIQEKRDLILSSGHSGYNLRTTQDSDVLKRKPRPPYLVIVARLE
jgi:hypothetical protein